MSLSVPWGHCFRKAGVHFCCQARLWHHVRCCYWILVLFHTWHSFSKQCSKKSLTSQNKKDMWDATFWDMWSSIGVLGNPLYRKTGGVGRLIGSTFQFPWYNNSHFSHLKLTVKHQVACKISRHFTVSSCKWLKISSSIFLSVTIGLTSFGIDWFGPCSPRDSQESSPAQQFESITSSALSLLY